MAGILGLGSSGSTELSSELIDKLKSAEYTSRVTPIEEDLETWDTESEKIIEISSKIVEFMTSMKNFDLYNSENAFESYVGDTSGTSASFTLTDSTKLVTGTTTVNVSQLAQRDVYQSDTFSDSDSVMSTGQNDDDKLIIQIGDETFEFSTQGKTYQQLTDEINYKIGLTATIEKVSDSSYRLIVKSTDTGTDNALTITQSDGLDLGFATESNHTLSSQNMIATVDGTEYNLSSNTIALGTGLTITAVSTGQSTINIEKDTSSLSTYMEDFVSQYNELVELVNDELYSDDSSLYDASSIKSMMSQIKDMFMSGYGDDGELNLFSFGFSFDTDGYLSVDSSDLADAITNNYDDLKSLFVGKAETPGLGTQLKEYLDALDGWEGLLTVYTDSMTDRKTKLEEEKEEEIEKLDDKYEQMAQQFAEYTAIITSMENAFASMKQLLADDDD
ncbi:MAG: flagellar filament capping protein FliD [Arcobacteraceae bacterium]|nr:flagellar filament capping protein FliD [Arcobacteraceae bacterium]